MGKLLLFSFFYATSLWAQTVIPENCPPELKGKLEAQILAEQVMNRENDQCPNGRTYPDHFKNAKTMGEVKTIFNEKMRGLGLAGDWESGTGIASHWEAFTDEDESALLKVKQMANTLTYALSLYPAGAFRKMGLEKVRLVKDLTVNPPDLSPQKRQAMPEPGSKAIAYSPQSNYLCQPKLEAMIHHELFHLIEGTVHKNMYLRDQKWQELNPADFSYKSGGASSYEVAGFRNKEHPAVGFASEYAAYGEEEDRSEVFSQMMTSGYAARLEGWTTVDPILNAKRNFIKDFLRSKVSPDMNEAYFKKLIDP